MLERKMSALLAGAALAVAAQAQQFTELHVNPIGSGNNGREFIEILATPGFNFNGYRIIIIEGDGTGAGTVDQNISLDGFVAGTNGLLLIRDSATVLTPAPDPATSVVIRDFNPDIENGSNTYLLGSGTFASVGIDLDTNNDGTIDAPVVGFTVTDAVAFTENALDSRQYADDFGGTNLGGFVGFTPDAIYRVLNSDCTTTLAWVGGDLQGLDPGPYNFDDARSFGFIPLTLEASATLLSPGSANVCLPLGVAVGACCLPGQVCRILPGDYCTTVLGGTYQGDGTSCSPNPCAPPPATGACCTVDGCVIATRDECTALGGAYQGDRTACTPDPCPTPTGACCLDGGCEVLTASACAGRGGRYLGNGLSCAEVECGRLSAPFITELLANPPGSNDGNEAIELQAPAGFRFNGYSLVVIDGDLGTVPPAGTVDVRLSLNGVVAGANGLVLIRDSSTVLLPAPDPATTVVVVETLPDIENGANTYLLGYGIFPSVSTDLDANDDGAIDVPVATFFAVDSVSYVNGDEPGVEYADDFGGTSLGDLGTYTPDSIYRILNCAGTAPETGVVGLPGGWAGADLLGTIPGPFLYDPLEFFGFGAVGLDPSLRSPDFGSGNYRNCPVCLEGDSNGDGLVDFNDIDCYVAALVGEATWQTCSSAPDADYLCRNDINDDGAVNFDDIDGMVACLVSGVCP